MKTNYVLMKSVSASESFVIFDFAKQIKQGMRMRRGSSGMFLMSPELLSLRSLTFYRKRKEILKNIFNSASIINLNKHIHY